jgi:rhamnosyltransferase
MELQNQIEAAAPKPGATEAQVALIIPTYNAALHWSDLCAGIRSQNLLPKDMVIIDSSSTDGTPSLAQEAGFTVIRIHSEDFNHGGTRQFAAEHVPDADILIYLTQDAIPASPDAFSRIIAAFDDPEIGAAYGRQLPRPNASSIEAHARLFNYPPKSSVRLWESRLTLGFRSIFFSNSFGAYRRDALRSVGGFAPDVIFGEDALVVARLHRIGWKTAYVTDAVVEHSHSYTFAEEFRRYFDIGVFHARERWLIEQFGTASGEGRRFVISELTYLVKNDPLRIPSALIRTLVKYLGYKIGRHENQISARLKPRLGMNRMYWSQ